MNHLLLTQEMISQIDGSTYGAKMPRASWDFIGNLPVARPPLDEQEKIASFLDAELKKLDDTIGEMERMASLAREKRQAYISYAVTCGLDADVPKKASGFNWIGSVPSHWRIVRLKFLARVQSGIPKGRSMEGKESITVPYLRVANVQDGFLDLTKVSTIEIAPQELARFLLQHGDVLMNEGGDFDKLGRGQVWRGEIAKCIHQNHVFAVRPHDVQPEWLALITTAHCGRFFFMSRAKQSTNLASISSSNLRELRVPMPPPDERQDVLSAVQEHSNRMDKLASEALHAAGFLRERRAALISAAITGKIDVRGLTPAMQEAA
jgi:type I restriction enzyme S subunit